LDGDSPAILVIRGIVEESNIWPKAGEQSRTFRVRRDRIHSGHRRALVGGYACIELEFEFPGEFFGSQPPIVGGLRQQVFFQELLIILQRLHDGRARLSRRPFALSDRRTRKSHFHKTHGAAILPDGSLSMGEKACGGSRGRQRLHAESEPFGYGVGDIGFQGNEDWLKSR